MNQLPKVDQWVAVVNVVCVSMSVIVNWWAARSGLFRFRTVHAAIAAVSGLYVVGYLWLLGLLPGRINYRRNCLLNGHLTESPGRRKTDFRTR